MRNKYSILHISDIHRGEHTNLDNLFESMVCDSEKYSLGGILKPSIIVVSGDVAEGAFGVDAEEKIRAQYKEVSDFLSKLVNHFLDGDRQRILIVPGNHDIFWGMSKSSMVKYDISESDNIQKLRDNPNFRWSWNDLCFYRIKHPEIYAKRFDLFVDFYNRFFDGIRSISDVPDEFSDIVDLPDFGTAFALFNSCYKLDHLRYAGTINPSSLTKQARLLRDLSRKGRLIIGVWHHHINGLPMEDNYLDFRILQPMVANRIHVGLFGHQHCSQIISHYSSVEDERQMLLVSSGSLYGGCGQLTLGCSRQYNVIEVSLGESKADITINVREDAHPDYEIPDWTISPIGKKLQQTNYSQTIDLESVDIDMELLNLNDEANRTGDYDAAIHKLFEQYQNCSRYNELLDRFLNKANLSPSEASNILKHPQSEVQAIVLLSAVDELGSRTLAEQIVEDDFLLHSDSAIVRDMYRQIMSKFNIK